MKPALHETSVALARLALAEDKSGEQSLREQRKESGLSLTMERQEIALAVNAVSKEDEMEGDEFLQLLSAVEEQEEQFSESQPEEEKKLFESEIVVLKEGVALNEDGTINICIITPGWGNSGYYSEDLLKNSASVFSEGLHMYWDHPTVSDEWQRPERSLRDLAGVLAAPAEWREQGFGGAGLYSTAKVFSPYMESLDDMAPHIGVSVIIYAMSHVGEVDDTQGDIIDQIVAARCVDFVTLPARGGRIEAKFESLKEGRRIKQLIEGGKGGELVDNATAQKLKDDNERLQNELAESRKESQSFRDVALKTAAEKLVEAELGNVQNLPEQAREKIQLRLSEKPILKDGKVDEEATKAAVESAVKEEAAYLAKLGLDKVTDLGPTTSQNGNGQEIDEKEYTEGLKSTFESLGLSEDAAKIAARGR